MLAGPEWPLRACPGESVRTARSRCSSPCAKSRCGEREDKRSLLHNEITANAPASFAATDPQIVWKTVAQGAATSVPLAASPLLGQLASPRPGVSALAPAVTGFAGPWRGPARPRSPRSG